MQVLQVSQTLIFAYNNTPKKKFPDEWFKDNIYIKYSRKGYFIKDYKGGQQNYIVKGTNML